MESDLAAIRRCKGGDRDAFRHLVEQYQSEAIAHARAILANREDALDAVQEAFLDAFQALDRFDVERPFYPWFYTILRHRCLKLMAGRKRHMASSLDDTLVLAPAMEVPAEDVLALEHALLDLAPQERELITLKHLDGLSYRELAERLEIPLGTVMSRLYHARKRLHEQLSSKPIRRL